MGVRSFGQYLLEAGAITADQLLSAFEYQDAKHRRFGETAIAMGFLTEDQLKTVLRLHRGSDLKIRDAALRMGMISEVQADEVYRKQKTAHVPIGEALVAVGALSRRKMERYLESFKGEQRDWAAGPFSRDHDPTGLAVPAVTLLMEILFHSAGLQTKLMEVKAGTLPPIIGPTFAVNAKVMGEVRGTVVLRAAAAVCAKIVSGMIGEPVRASDAEALTDGLAELLNLFGGSFPAEATKIGRNIEVSAPIHDPVPPPSTNDHVMIARLAAPEGEIDLVLVTARP